MPNDLPNLSDPPSQTSPQSPLTRALRRRAATLISILALLWLIYLLDALLFHHSLAQHGIVPRSLRGLPGILFAPFLHASLSHLLSNSLGIIFLGGLLILHSESAFWTITLLGALLSGLGTWFIGRGNAVHIGASGIIFAYFGFLLANGIFQRRLGPLLLSLLTFFLYGGLLWSALPSLSNTPLSWEAHLSGLAAGALTAKLLAPKPRKT